MVNFSALLSKTAGEAKKPVPLPGGDYPGVITKWEPGESRGEKKSPLITFTVVPNAWAEGIDPSEYPEIDLSKRVMRKDFFLTDDALYRLDSFIKDLGIDATGRSYAEVLPEVVGSSVLMVVKQQMKKDNSGDMVSFVDDLKPNN